MMKNIFKELIKFYGSQDWWRADSDYEIMIGAILTQNTNWKNVEKALKNLKPELSPQFIRDIEEEDLAQKIRPSGYYRQKAKRLKTLNRWFEQYDFDFEKVKKVDDETLRKELLSIKGIGGETADSILVYVFQKPFFIIDAYTRRIFSRVGIEVPKKYDDFRKKIEQEVKKDVNMYATLHGMIVQLAKSFCLKTPQCQNCPLSKICQKTLEKKHE